MKQIFASVYSVLVWGTLMGLAAHSKLASVSLDDVAQLRESQSAWMEEVPSASSPRFMP